MENRLSRVVISRNGSINGGVMKLPPGFRFQPTDEELVFQYLKCKILSCPLPASIIPHLLINLCNHHPWDLPGNPMEERYFFSMKESRYRNGKRANRVALSGYWKATGADKQITKSKTNHSSSSSSSFVVGMKKTLVFYMGKPPHGSRTHWVMHEYRLVASSLSGGPSSDFPQGCLEDDVGRWVLCRVFCRRRRKSDDDCEVTAGTFNHEANCNYEGVMAGRRRPSLLIDFMGKLDHGSTTALISDGDSISSNGDLPSSSLSSTCSSSSTITRLSSTGIGFEEEEEESSINFF